MIDLFVHLFISLFTYYLSNLFINLFSYLFVYSSIFLRMFALAIFNHIHSPRGNNEIFYHYTYPLGRVVNLIKIWSKRIYIVWEWKADASYFQMITAKNFRELSSESLLYRVFDLTWYVPCRKSDLIFHPWSRWKKYLFLLSA